MKSRTMLLSLIMILGFAGNNYSADAAVSFKSQQCFYFYKNTFPTFNQFYLHSNTELMLALRTEMKSTINPDTIAKSLTFREFPYVVTVTPSVDIIKQILADSKIESSSLKIEAPRFSLKTVDLVDYIESNFETVFNSRRSESEKSILAYYYILARNGKLRLPPSSRIELLQNLFKPVLKKLDLANNTSISLSADQVNALVDLVQVSITLTNPGLTRDSAIKHTSQMILNSFSSNSEVANKLVHAFLTTSESKLTNFGLFEEIIKSPAFNSVELIDILTASNALNSTELERLQVRSSLLSPRATSRSDEQSLALYQKLTQMVQSSPSLFKLELVRNQIAGLYKKHLDDAFQEFIKKYIGHFSKPEDLNLFTAFYKNPTPFLKAYAENPKTFSFDSFYTILERAKDLEIPPKDLNSATSFIQTIIPKTSDKTLKLKLVGLISSKAADNTVRGKLVKNIIDEVKDSKSLTIDDTLLLLKISKFSKNLFTETTEKSLTAKFSFSELKRLYEDFPSSEDKFYSNTLHAKILRVLTQKVSVLPKQSPEIEQYRSLQFLYASLAENIKAEQKVVFANYFKAVNKILNSVVEDQWLINLVKSATDSELIKLYDSLSKEYYYKYFRTIDIKFLFQENKNSNLYFSVLEKLAHKPSPENLFLSGKLLTELTRYSILPLSEDIERWTNYAKQSIESSSSKEFDKNILNFVITAFKQSSQFQLHLVLDVYRKKYPSEKEFVLETSLQNPELAENAVRSFLTDTQISISESNDIVQSLYIRSPQFPAVLRAVAAKSRNRIVKGKIQFIEKLAPEIQTDRIDYVTTEFFESTLLNRTIPFAEIVRGQHIFDTAIKNKLDGMTRSSVLPTPFTSWNVLIQSVPLSYQATFLRDLLPRLDAGTLIQLISELPRNPSLRDVVINFLASSQLVHGSLGSGHFKAMFPGDSLKFYFPEYYSSLAQIEFNTSQLKVAIAMAQRKPIDAALSNSLGTTGQVVAFGYKPIETTEQLTQLLGSFPRENAVEHFGTVNGLIVHGFYERNGYTTMRSRTGRGDQQVETELPELHRAMLTQLSSGRLAGLDLLSKRHIVYGWGFQSSGSLIESIRQRAIRVADSWNTFYNLRVEIHNFPTLDVLKRVQIRASTAPTNVKSELDRLIGEIEQLHGISKVGNVTLEATLSELRFRDQHKNKMTAMARGLTHDPKSDLALITKMRETLKADMLGSGDPSDLHAYFVVDRALSQQAFILSEKLLTTSSKITSREGLDQFQSSCSEILNQIFFDNQISANQLNSYRNELAKIASDRSLAAQRQAELMSSLIENAVEQVYFAFEEKFGMSDSALNSIMKGRHAGAPPHFIDSTLRSSNVFVLSKLVDKAKREVTEAKNIKHSINAQGHSEPIEVFNPGTAIGTIRLNKDPMTLTKNEIAVFTDVPGETSALGGIITLGSGARLSHLQLLAKSLRIPNIKMDKEYGSILMELDGKEVSVTAGKNGEVRIEALKSEDQKLPTGRTSQMVKIEIPVPDHSIVTPISFEGLKESGFKFVAGPKGVHLAKMRAIPELRDHVPDGFVLPFGYFDKYAVTSGMKRWFQLLSRLKLDNSYAVSTVLSKIQNIIDATPIPTEMLDQAMKELENLNTKSSAPGFFFRSDTNIEDLPNFNGAGLNESVANVALNRTDVERAIRKVWRSAFSQKSVYWRGLAIGNEYVSIAEPSIVVMPTVQAQSSGVVISKGGPNWQPGLGFISANWGIGSVVESGRPVEEITMENGVPQRFTLTTSHKKPVANSTGGMSTATVEPGTLVLSDANAKQLIQFANTIEKHLGSQPHGWDIEWAVDINNKLEILQARPNM